jgi:hypothetical protein
VLHKALAAAACRDIYWSNEYFYRWLSLSSGTESPARSPSRSIDPECVKTATIDGLRVEIRHRTFVSAARRLAAVRRLARDGRVPGAWVALARAMAKQGQLERALQFATSALADCRALGQREPGLQVHIVENQIAALQRAIAGRRVPRALARYLGDDGGYLKARTCHIPLERIDIQEDGNCAVCCAAWMPGFSLGNVFAATPALEIYNNPHAVAVRQSVLDGSFKFCDLVKCPATSGDALPTKEEAVAAWPGNTKEAVESGKLQFKGPAIVSLILDKSCNLSCPSCRSHIITEKIDMQERKEALINTSIAPLLLSARRMHVNPAGELFVSRPLRRLLGRLNRDEFPKLNLAIISNGTLFNRSEWEKFPGIHAMTESVRISTDAASKVTFEKLRRGGHWETFCENLQFIASLKTCGAIKWLFLSFTYQLENFQEMPAFVEMARSLHPETIVIFEKLENWGTFTPDEYRAKAVHDAEHALHDEFLSVIRNPRLAVRSPQLRADYFGLL